MGLVCGVFALGLCVFGLNMVLEGFWVSRDGVVKTD